MDMYKCLGCQTSEKTNEKTNIQKVILSPGSLQAGTTMLGKPVIKPSGITGGFRPLLSIPEHH